MRQPVGRRTVSCRPTRRCVRCKEDQYDEVVLERVVEEVELPGFQELEEVKLQPAIFNMLCKELVVAPCSDLFPSCRHHELPRY